MDRNRMQAKAVDNPVSKGIEIPAASVPANERTIVGHSHKEGTAT